MYCGRTYSICQVQFQPPDYLFIHQSYPLAFSGINVENLIFHSSDLSVFSSQMHKILPIGVLVNTVSSFYLLFLSNNPFVLK